MGFRNYNTLIESALYLANLRLFLPILTRVPLATCSKYGPVLASGGKLDLLAGSDKVVGLGGVVELSKEMLKGNITGRYVVDVNK